jgi:hypothetical protein
VGAVGNRSLTVAARITHRNYNQSRGRQGAVAGRTSIAEEGSALSIRAQPGLCAYS